MKIKIPQSMSLKTLSTKKYYKPSIVMIVIIALVVSGFTYLGSRTKAASASSVQQRFEKVKRGDMNITLSGSGPLVSSNRTDITSKVAGTLLNVNFKEGATVKAGDVLFELDDSNAKLNVEKLSTSLAQKKLTQNNNIKDGNNLKLTAPFDGYITGIQIKNGDLATKNATMLTITDQSQLKMMVSFSGTVIDEIYVGKQVNVNILNLMQTVPGTITYIGNKPHSTSLGGELYNVEITISNPGSIKEGMKAGAEISTSKGTASSNENGTLTCINSMVLRSSTGGTVLNVLVKENQFVYKGELLADLQNDEILLNIETTEVSIKDLEGQLENAKNELAYYKITSPIDGVIVKQSVNAGDAIKAAQIVTTVSNTKQMEFNIAVDELDIAKVKIGQKVSIIVDAITETAKTALIGEVGRIAIEGTSSNGVTTYPVTIKLTGNDTLRSGMNSNGVISIENRKNILMVPIEAITRVGGRSYVRVRSDGSQTNTNSASSDNKNQGSSAFSRSNLGSNRSNFDTANIDSAKAAIKNANQGSNSGSNQGTVTGAAQNAAQGTAQSASQSAAQGTSSGDVKGAAQEKVINPKVNTGNSSGLAGILSGNNKNSTDYYANTVLKVIEIGITNDSYAEIVSGLAEGEEVLLPQITGSNNNSTRINGVSGMAIPGGVPAGGGGQIQQQFGR